jgi:hypothetical protein
MLPRFSSDYYLEFIGDLSHSYIHRYKGKRRFKQLPHILEEMNRHSKAYKEFAANLEKFAAEKNCHPKSIADAREWEDFKW